MLIFFNHSQAKKDEETDEMKELRRAIRKLLNTEKVQLWVEPFTDSNGNSTMRPEFVSRYATLVSRTSLRLSFPHVLSLSLSLSLCLCLCVRE